MSRGFVIMGALIVALSGYLAWDLRSEKTETTRKEEQAKLFPFKADQVNELRIDRPDLQLKITRSEDGWKIETPIQDLADNDFTDDTVQRMVEERSLDVAKEGEGLDLKVYGLDKPAGSITLKTQSGQSKTYEVSTTSNFEQNSFIREAGVSKVLIAAGTWPLAVQRGPLDFRNKRLFRGKIASMDQLEVRNSRGVTRLVSKDGKWSVSDQPEWEIDQNRVREVLSMINETRVDDFVIERTPTAAEKASFGLGKPAVTIRARVGEGTWSAEFGLSKEKMPHAWVTPPDVVLRMDSGGFQKFDRIEAADLREKKLPFDFNKDLARKIDLRTRVKTSAFVKKDGVWALEPAAKDIVAQQEKIDAMLGALRELTVARYGERQPRNAPALVNSLKLLGEDGATAFEMSWSDPQVRKIGDRESNVRWAKTNKYRDHFWLEETSLEKLQLNDLAGPPAPPAPSEPAKEKALE